LTYTWAGKITINGVDYAYNNTSNTVIVDMLNSIDESDLGRFRVYPNPALDIINVEFENGARKIYIYNQIGHLVLSRELISKQSTVDVSALNTGIFIIKSEGGGSQTIIKK